MALSAAVRSQISELVEKHPVVLFMKGTRHQPQCGFSSQVVQILDDLLPSYETVNVLESPELREGVKEYSQWPTIPQLFVKGQLVGGCDIVRELSASGELPNILGVQAAEVPTPKISVTPAAAKAFETALGDTHGELLHLAIDGRFTYDLFLGPRTGTDIEVQTDGPTLLLDRQSARRADGLSIDFVAGPKGGFKMQNPNEPPKVVQLSPADLKAMHDRDEVALFDVRPERERALASIPWARPLDAAGQEHLLGLDKSTPIAFLCHHGVRSQGAAEQLLREGFKRVYNVAGGIDGWSLSVDPSVPRY
jgi:monothiol glutaredoxin